MNKLQFPTVTETTVNGIRIAHIHTSHLMTYTAFLSLCGSYTETKEQQGISHILEHMFFKGTKNRDMFQICEDAALMGAIQNAYTSQYEVSYHLTAPHDYTEGQIELLSDMMFNSTFPAEEWEKERNVIQEERKMYDSQHLDYFYKTIGEQMLCEQWNHEVIGYEDTIDAITQEDIVNFRNTKYGQDNTVFLIATPIDFKTVVGYCEKYFGELTEKSDIFAPNVNVLNGTKDLEITRAGIDQSFVVGLFDYGNVRDDKRHSFLKSLVTYMVGGGMNSMLFKEVREKSALCYSVGAGKFLSCGDHQLGFAHTQLSPQNAQTAITKIEDVFEDARVGGFTDRQLQAVKAQFLTSLYGALGSSSAIAGAAKGKILRNMPFTPEENQEIINSVTLDEVNDTAKEFIGGIDFHWAEMKPE